MKSTSGRNVVVVGSQWGDEGKGKLVDWLTELAASARRCTSYPAASCARA